MVLRFVEIISTVLHRDFLDRVAQNFVGDSNLNDSVLSKEPVCLFFEKW